MGPVLALAQFFRYGPGMAVQRHKRIRYVKVFFQGRRGAASLRYKNRAEITVVMCEQKPYPVWFSCRRKRCLVYCKQSVIISPVHRIN